MCKENFCNLHVHSQYSILDGYGTPKRLVQRAVELGQPALSVTDHGSMSGLIAVKEECDKNGIKFIPGSELYIAPWGKDVHWRRDDNKRTGTGHHLTVWAYNQQGYTNLLKLTELANKVGFFHVPRIDYDMLAQYNEGLIVTSGCMASTVCSALNPETGVTSKSYRIVNNVFAFMYEIFGLDRYFIELQGNDIPALRSINVDLFRVNKLWGFDYLATNDAHYAFPEDNVGQVDVMCVSQKCSRLNPNKFIAETFQGKEYYMRSLDEMQQLDYGFDVPASAFSNTVKVADMVETIYLGYEPEVKKYRFPVMPEYEHNYDDELEKIAGKGFSRLYAKQDWESWEEFGVTEERFLEAAERLAYELVIIKKLGFASYFLCVYDIKCFCDKESIPMTVRGSAGGSIVLHCLGVTDFCPLEYNLIFERFLNPDRVSAPDADLDIDPNKRDKVIKYIIEKYGKDKVAQVVNFNYIKGKRALRDAAKLNEQSFDLGSVLINRLVDIDKSTVVGTVSEDSDHYVKNFAQTPIERDILDTALRIEGQIRDKGMHAGALMLSDTPLVEHYPMMRPKTTSKAVTELLVAFNYETAEKVGGIKLDLLNVEALGILYRAIELINQRHKTNYVFDNIPVDDQVSYDLINSGHLAEIFQLNKYAARIATAIIKPKTIEDVMVAASICRPGPAAYTQLYADRLHGKEEVTYKHPNLEDALADTQGIMLYQESVMRVSQVVAGFTGSQADTLRKAISKKKGFEKVRGLFIEGAKKRGYEDSFIKEIWDDMAEFAGYGFCMAHACAYARIACKQAYLKAKYPIEFYAAALTGRVNHEWERGELLKEMTKSGIKLLPPRLGKSNPRVFAVDDEAGGIRYPYGSVKNVGRAGNYLKYIDLNDIEYVTDDQLALFKKAGKRPLESLAVIGAFDHLFGGDRNLAVSGVEYLSKGVAPIRQLAFLPNENKYTKAEFYTLERKLTGLYLTGHPLDEYSLDQRNFNDTEWYEGQHDEMGLFVGVVSSIRTHRDRGGNIMAFVEMEDRGYNTMSVVVFASLYQEIDDRICQGCVIKVLGKINVRYGKTEEEEAKLKKYGRVSIVASNVIGE